MDKAFSFLAEEGLKGATAPRTVQRLILRPTGVPAVEIAEFHAVTITSFFSSFLALSVMTCPQISSCHPERFDV
jgi:hypothetical protein